MRPRPSVSLLSAGLIVAACSSPQQPPATHSRFYGDVHLRIGVRAELPGIGLYDPETDQWSGLDIAIANYVMARLNIPTRPGAPHLYPVLPEDRDNHLLRHSNDLIIASYSITDGRIQKGISFTTAYLLSYQDILVRSADADTIKTVDDLRGKQVCTGSQPSTPYQHLTALNQSRHLGMKIIPGGRAPVCVDKLIRKKADAVVADTAILFGYLSRHPDLHLVGIKVWPRPEQYGIGLIARTPADVNELNAVLKRMFDDGSWKKAVTTSFCPGIRPTGPPCRTAQLFLDNPPPLT